jgi:ATP-dependent protease Clp ATPase subunit
MSDEKTKEELAVQYRKIKKEFYRAMNEISQLIGDDPYYYCEWNEDETPTSPYCSFCGSGTNQVKHMLLKNKIYICDQCVKASRDIIKSCENENILTQPHVICSLCEQEVREKDAAKGPNELHICNACVSECLRVLKEMELRSTEK